jgi:putative tryptophan/tyrosine transport system substrate-binding protein
MKRRDFIARAGATAAASALPASWPRAVRAQQAQPMWRVGVLLRAIENDPLAKAFMAALRKGFQTLGWIEGRDLRIDVRFPGDDVNLMRAYAVELVRRSPDVIVVSGGPTTGAVLRETKTIPVIFFVVGDPVAGGFLTSIERPEGNVTGFTNLFPSIAGKWVELLKEAAPHVTRVGLLYRFEIPDYLAPIEAAATALALNAVRIPVRSGAEIERALAAFAAQPNGGLIIVPPPPAGDDLNLVLKLAVTHRMPAIYDASIFAVAGGLMSYGPDIVDLARRVPSYVDRIFRGAKIADLPVQFPTKFQLVVNLRTAKAMGLTIPEAFLLRADEVIE